MLERRAIRAASLLEVEETRAALLGALAAVTGIVELHLPFGIKHELIVPLRIKTPSTLSPHGRVPWARRLPSAGGAVNPPSHGMGMSGVASDVGARQCSLLPSRCAPSDPKSVQPPNLYVTGAHISKSPCHGAAWAETRDLGRVAVISSQVDDLQAGTGTTHTPPCQERPKCPSEPLAVVNAAMCPRQRQGAHGWSRGTRAETCTASQEARSAKTLGHAPSMCPSFFCAGLALNKGN